MPFFNIVMADDQVEHVADRIWLADLAAARRVAGQRLTRLVDAALPSIFESELQVKVTDDRGMLLFMLTAFVTEAPAMAGGVR
jgi:hypothetical protein